MVRHARADREATFVDRRAIRTVGILVIFHAGLRLLLVNAGKNTGRRQGTMLSSALRTAQTRNAQPGGVCGPTVDSDAAVVKFLGSRAKKA